MYDVIMATSETSLREAITEVVKKVNEKKKEGWRTAGGIDTNTKWPVYVKPEDEEVPSFYYACQAIEKD